MRRLAAIMFTDMVGFTALVQEDEHRAKNIRDRHREALREAIERHGGEIVQFYGDGTLSVFESAVEGVNAAVAAQRELRTGDPIPVRIGIHIGDINHDEDGIYGDGVNVASRIQDLSVPGAVLVSGKVFDEIRNHPEIPTKGLGRFELKNVRAPVALFAIADDALVTPDRDQMKSPIETKKSVAVLPFVNMSTDPENEFFSDGITEELINALARVEGLSVTARTSSFAFKGKHQDVRAIGRELGVGAILEGSVRKSGDRVRITAQLIDTRDGYHVFSKVYDRVLKDIFVTQDEISLKIANELRATFSTGAKQQSLVVALTENAEAHDRYLKGLYCWNQWTPDAARQGVVHFERAVELDPEFAHAWAAMARCHSFLVAMGRLWKGGNPYALAIQAAERAIELNPDIAESHVALALVRLLSDWDLPRAEESLIRALSISPDSVDVLHSYALFLSAAGRFDESVVALEKAARLDPLNLLVLDYLGRAYSAVSRFEEALAQFDRVVELDPEFRSALEGRGWTYVMMGQLDDAIATFEEMADLTPHPKGGITPLGVTLALAGRTAEAEQILSVIAERESEEKDVSLHLDFASIYAALGRTEDTLDRLRKAVEARSGAIVFIRHHKSWSVAKVDGISEFLTEIGL